MVLKHKENTILFELLLVLSALFFGAWLFILPVLKTFGQQTLFSDDAIHAILARKVLEGGLESAFHLTWAPMFPWLIALLNKFFMVPIEDGGRMITSLSLVARIVPTWFLAREIFGRRPAIFALLIIVPASFFITGTLASQPETLYSFLLITAASFGWLGLRDLKPVWFALSGTFMSLTFLTRHEGFLMSIPIIVFMLLAVFLSKRKIEVLSKTIVPFFVAFLVVSFPYLRFTRQVYGSWAISPKAGITFTQPGNPFGKYQDKNGLTTLAQVFFSPDEPNYNSNLWHPDFEIVRKHTQLIRDGFLKRITSYMELIKVGIRSPYLYYLFLAGVLLPFINKGKIKLFINILLLLVLILGFVDLVIYFLEFSFAEPKIWFANRFLKYPRMEILIESLVVVFIARYFLRKKKVFLKDFNDNRQDVYLLSFMFFGLTALMVANIFAFYLQWMVPIIAIMAGLTIEWIFKKIGRYVFLVPGVVFMVIAFVYWPLYSYPIEYRNISVANEQLQRLYKLPGLAILNDYGKPGAKIAVFHEGSVYYAKGKTFYFLTDGNTTLSETMAYFENNNVDYVVATQDEIWGNVQLRPLLDTKNNLDHWQVIYANQEIQTSPILVWRRI